MVLEIMREKMVWNPLTPIGSWVPFACCPLVWSLICNHWVMWPCAICPCQNDILAPMSGVHCPRLESQGLMHTLSFFILALASIRPRMPQWLCLPQWGCWHLSLLCTVYMPGAPRHCPRSTALTSCCILIEISVWPHIFWSPVKHEHEAPCSKSC